MLALKGSCVAAREMSLSTLSPAHILVSQPVNIKKKLLFFWVEQRKIEMLSPARLFGGRRRECDRKRLMVLLG